MCNPDTFLPLPLIMVAPNGARRTKTDHSALPMTIGETVEAAKACFNAGADGLHAHVRDVEGAHVLDAGLYRDLMSEMKISVPQMLVQITTEAVGKYTPGTQRQLVKDVGPKAVSIAVGEMVPDEDVDAAREFYAWAADTHIAVQHILYDVGDVKRFFDLTAAGVIPGESHQLLFVLGRYAENQESAPEDLEPFLQELSVRKADFKIDWAVCAFGRRETECLTYAIEHGGKVRIGFENGLWNRNGELAKDNADRVRDLVTVLNERNIYPVG